MIPETAPKAIICSVEIKAPRSVTKAVLSPLESAHELERLAHTLGFQVIDTVIQTRQSPDNTTFLGKGKVQELIDLVAEKEADVILIDGILSPTQSHNLEDELDITVLDRTEVILRIFAQRASTKEGKLQVELATRKHELSRLTGYGTAMSTLGAGIGTRGPGEQKLEVDRRVLRNRITWLSKELEKAANVRKEQGKKRKESDIPLISLVGYTNSGKSTLFAALTGEDAFRDDLLFATLDPWTRKWELPSGRIVLVSDTVGFIQGLPHELIHAFRSTLEQSLDAHLLIHVVDSSSYMWMQQMQTVEQVLDDLGASDTPVIIAFNKTDISPDNDLMTDPERQSDTISISALHNQGIDKLAQVVEQALLAETRVVSLEIPYSNWDIVAQIRQAGTIIEKINGETGATITCRMRPADIERFSKKLADTSDFS